jgi:hypothetical protein
MTTLGQVGRHSPASWPLSITAKHLMRELSQFKFTSGPPGQILYIKEDLQALNTNLLYISEFPTQEHQLYLYIRFSRTST